LTGCALRGGSWILVDPDAFRAAYRIGYVPDIRYFNIGFRFALGLQRRF